MNNPLFQSLASVDRMYRHKGSSTVPLSASLYFERITQNIVENRHSRFPDRWRVDGAFHIPSEPRPGQKPHRSLAGQRVVPDDLGPKASRLVSESHKECRHRAVPKTLKPLGPSPPTRRRKACEDKPFNRSGRGHGHPLSHSNHPLNEGSPHIGRCAGSIICAADSSDPLFANDTLLLRRPPTLVASADGFDNVCA